MLGHSEAPTTGTLSTIPEDPAAVDVRRKGCKVSPEPKEGEEPAASLPGSPSFRIYCQNAARVDALVAAAAADGGESDEPANAMGKLAVPVRVARLLCITQVFFRCIALTL